MAAKVLLLFRWETVSASVLLALLQCRQDLGKTSEIISKYVLQKHKEELL
jgi:hypothetical protein